MDTHHTHNDLHSEQGALSGERLGRAVNPVIKVRDLAWLEFEKPDLEGAEIFGHALGFATSYQDTDELHLRGTLVDSPTVIVRRGAISRFTGPAPLAAEQSDLLRLGDHIGIHVTPRPTRRRSASAWTSTRSRAR